LTLSAWGHETCKGELQRGRGGNTKAVPGDQVQVGAIPTSNKRKISSIARSSHKQEIREKD